MPSRHCGCMILFLYFNKRQGFTEILSLWLVIFQGASLGVFSFLPVPHRKGSLWVASFIQHHDPNPRHKLLTPNVQSYTSALKGLWQAKVTSLVCRFWSLPRTNGPNTQFKWKLRYNPIQCAYLEPSVTHFSNCRRTRIGLEIGN